MSDIKTIEVVAAVIKAQDKIFAVQRSGRAYKELEGLWEFPGGKVESGETLPAALIREINEELATEIAVGELIQTIEYDYPTFHLIMHCFLCTVLYGDLTLKEHNAVRWLRREELDSVTWLPADRSLIKLLGEKYL